MKMSGFYNKRIVLPILLSGILGAIFFFPVQMNGRYTCAYHRLFEAENPVAGISKDSNRSIDAEYQTGEHEHSESPFLHRYLHNYAMLWWLSIVLIAFSIYGLRKNKELKNKTEDFVNG